MHRIWKDIERALAGFRQSTAFSLTIVVTLAVAIGANTTIFSMVNAMLLNQLPYDAPDRLTRVYSVMENRDNQKVNMSALDVHDLSAASVSFEALDYFVYYGMSYGGKNRPMDISGTLVSPGYLSTLGARPHMGRVFDESDIGKKSVVISYGLWQRELGSRPDVLGEQILLNAEPYDVIGVMNPQINYPDNGIQFWGLLDTSDWPRRSRSVWAIGRLKPNVTLEQANAELTVLTDQLEETHRDTNEHIGAAAVPLLEDIAGNLSNALWILMSVVFFVLLIACANVANMFLSRGAARTRELGVRVAMGASRSQIVGMLLTESLVYALIAGLLGALLSYAAMDFIVGALVSLDMPRGSEVKLDLAVLAFALGLCLMSALLAGLIPALRVSQVKVSESLKSAGKQSADTGSGRLRHALSIAAVAMSLALLITSLLLIRTFNELQAVDAGYDPTQTAAVQLWVSDEPEARLTFLNTILDSLNTNPGITEAGMTTYLPLDYINGRGTQEVVVQGRTEAEPKRSSLVSIAGDYVAAVRMESKAGRTLDSSLNNSSESVVWVNEALARAYFPDADPLGEFLTLEAGIGPLEVVGVLGDVKMRALNRESEPVVYLPNSISPTIQMNIVARGAGQGENLAEILKDAVWDVNPTQPIYRAMSLEDQRDQELAGDKLYAQAVSAFAIIAVFLACVGLYSVVSYNVSQRRAEFGLRGALGATRSRILLGVLRQSGLSIAAGLGIGLLLAAGGAKFLRSQLFGVSPLDPTTLILATGVLAAVGLAASFFPARRATQVEPMTALRFE